MRELEEETETERGDRLREMSLAEVNASLVAVAAVETPGAGYELKDMN